MGSTTISVDEFQALEARVLQAVELIRKEREARATAEGERDWARGEVEGLRKELADAHEAKGHLQHESEALKVQVSGLESQLADTKSQLATAQGEVAGLQEKVSAASQAEVEHLNREREAVKSRVEKMLAQMDELL
ncbi:hypothetical protein ACFQBQ_09990 [Granulicella cerasi]|uniref:Uncharacterized protein n=1 Tax=Granulicella cerasi TaxID=741063 RepID=A0ABW1Z924_9BACT|nr:hypothetical protein [Granulicella cerasi]